MSYLLGAGHFSVRLHFGRKLNRPSIILRSLIWNGFAQRYNDKDNWTHGPLGGIRDLAANGKAYLS